MTSCAVNHPASTSVGTNSEGNAVAGNAALDVALHVARCFGWRVFPVHRGTKWPHIKGWPDRASRKPEVILKWAAMFPGCNWGLVCGRGSGVIVVDEDQLEAADALGLPVCPICITGSGGRHFFLAWQPGIKRDTTKKKVPGCDILSDRSFVVLAGSVHANGNPYVWLVSPDDVGLPPVPTELAERLMATAKAKGSRCGPRGRSRGSASVSLTHGSSATRMSARNLSPNPGVIPWHARNDTLFLTGSSMRGRGASEDQILEELRIRYRNDCEKVTEDPFTDAELLGIVASVMKFPAGGGGLGLLSETVVPDVPAELFQDCRSPWVSSIYEVLLARRDRMRLVEFTHKAVCDGLQYRGYRNLPAPRTITRCITRLVKMGLAWRPSRAKLAQNTLDPRKKHYLLGVRHPDDPPPLSVTDNAADAVGTIRSTSSPRITLTTNTPSPLVLSQPLCRPYRSSSGTGSRAAVPDRRPITLIEASVEDLLRELCPVVSPPEGGGEGGRPPTHVKTKPKSREFGRGSVLGVPTARLDRPIHCLLNPAAKGSRSVDQAMRASGSVAQDGAINVVVHAEQRRPGRGQGCQVSGSAEIVELSIAPQVKRQHRALEFLRIEVLLEEGPDGVGDLLPVGELDDAEAGRQAGIQRRLVATVRGPERTLGGVRRLFLADPTTEPW